MGKVFCSALRRCLCLFLLSVVVASSWASESERTRVYMVGTGTPVPESHRAGAAVAVVYDDRTFLFDSGATASNRLEILAEDGETGLYPHKLKHLFFTHMHSDHMLGYPAVLFSLWWLREEPLSVYGPPGTQAMTGHLLAAFSQDTDIRINTVINPTKIQVPDPVVSEIDQPGIVYDDGEVKIEAFWVDHGDIEPAYGYKVTTPDKETVISGDTTYDERISSQARGADYLIHEVYSEKGLVESGDPDRPQRYDYHAHQYSSIEQIAEIAKQANPGLLVLTHILSWTDTIENMEARMADVYDGNFVFAEDAMLLD